MIHTPVQRPESHDRNESGQVQDLSLHILSIAHAVQVEQFGPCTLCTCKLLTLMCHALVTALDVSLIVQIANEDHTIVLSRGAMHYLLEILFDKK